jgi:hypothetical protein
MRCEDEVNCCLLDLGDYPTGQVLHDADHLLQALIVSDETIDGEYLPALIFDLNTKQRIIESSSLVRVPVYRSESRWHIAEHYELGMDVPMPPPSINLIECRYSKGTLVRDEPCPCGCGHGNVQCNCDYCYPCDRYVPPSDGLCSTCENHSNCVCNCECDNTVQEEGDLCSYCDDTILCYDCESTHDTNLEGRCDYCQDIENERVRKLEAEEVLRQEEAARIIAGAS